MEGLVRRRLLWGVAAEALVVAGMLACGSSSTTEGVGDTDSGAASERGATDGVADSTMMSVNPGPDASGDTETGTSVEGGASQPEGGSEDSAAEAGSIQDANAGSLADATPEPDSSSTTDASEAGTVVPEGSTGVLGSGSATDGSDATVPADAAPSDASVEADAPGDGASQDAGPYACLGTPPTSCESCGATYGCAACQGCSDAGECSGTPSQTGSCSGTPNSCSAYSPGPGSPGSASACTAAGCLWTSSPYELCSGTPPACTTYTSQGNCAVAGCTWSPPACSTQTMETACQTESGCTWSTCTGGLTPCVNLTQATCGTQPGCSWAPASCTDGAAACGGPSGNSPLLCLYGDAGLEWTPNGGACNFGCNAGSCNCTAPLNGGTLLGGSETYTDTATGEYWTVITVGSSENSLTAAETACAAWNDPLAGGSYLDGGHGRVATFADLDTLVAEAPPSACSPDFPSQLTTHGTVINTPTVCASGGYLSLDTTTGATTCSASVNWLCVDP